MSTYTIEWGHIDDYIRMLVKMKVPYEDFYRIIARPEAYNDNGFDQANVAALARLRDYDNHEVSLGPKPMSTMGLIKPMSPPWLGLGITTTMRIERGTTT